MKYIWFEIDLKSIWLGTALKSKGFDTNSIRCANQNNLEWWIRLVRLVWHKYSTERWDGFSSATKIRTFYLKLNPTYQRLQATSRPFRTHFPAQFGQGSESGFWKKYGGSFQNGPILSPTIVINFSSCTWEMINQILILILLNYP